MVNSKTHDMVNLTGLYPQEYEHPDDRDALNALRKIGGLDRLVARVNGWGVERVLRVQTTGSYLRVTADNIPDLHKIFIEARDRLSLPITPNLYVRSDESINAYTAGVQRPIVVLNSGAVDQLDSAELLFVLAHELGHVKSGHVLYGDIARIIPAVGSVIGDVTLGIGKLFSAGLETALLHWTRASELTADRAGLLACQDSDVAFRALMKLAGYPRKYDGAMNVQDIIDQANEFEALDASLVDKIVKVISIQGSGHPWTVVRAKELLSWIDAGDYDAVLKTPRAVAGDAGTFVRRFCDKCGLLADPADRFCRRCGNPLLGTSPEAVS